MGFSPVPPIGNPLKGPGHVFGHNSRESHSHACTQAVNMDTQAKRLGLGRGRGMLGLKMSSSTPTTIIRHPIGRGRGFLNIVHPIEPVYENDRKASTPPPLLPRAHVLREVQERPREALKITKPGRQVYYRPASSSRPRRRPRAVYPPLLFHARPEDFDRLAFSSTICAGHQHQLGLEGCMDQGNAEFPMVIKVTFWPRYPGRTSRLQFRRRPEH